jgi:hypothetical protein
MSRPSTPGIADETADAQAGTPPRLLRAHPAGPLAGLAAVDLLITHRHWLTRPAFTARFVHPVTAGDGARIGAWIDWPAAITTANGT